MQAPESSGTSRIRMITALAIFALTLGGGGLLVFGLPRVAKEKLSHNKTLSHYSGAPAEAEPGDESGFFYDAIGRTSAASAENGEATSAELAGDESDSDTPAVNSEAKISYTLEFKVAKSRDEAEKLIDTLHEQGIDAYYTPLARSGGVVYRVRRGIYPSQREADRAVLALKQEHHTDATVVKLQ